MYQFKISYNAIYFLPDKMLSSLKEKSKIVHLSYLHKYIISII